MVSLRSCAIVRHFKLKEHFDGSAIKELKEELSKPREVHTEELQTLKAKLKKVEDKCSAQEKEWEAKEKFLQDKITTLEGKVKE